MSKIIIYGLVGAEVGIFAYLIKKIITSVYDELRKKEI